MHIYICTVATANIQKQVLLIKEVVSVKQRKDFTKWCFYRSKMNESLHL